MSAKEVFVLWLNCRRYGGCAGFRVHLADARHGVPPLAARHLQEAIIGSTLMYESEVTWRGQRGMGRTFQRSINRMSRATLGVLPSTPVAFLQAEGGSIPATARLNRRQEAFAIRLSSTSGEPHGSLLRSRVGLGARLRGAVPEAERGGVERVGFSRGLVFPGEVVVPAEGRRSEDKEEGTKHAVDEARKMSGDMDTIWTDGSRLENGRVGAGIAWFEKGEETTGRIEVARRDIRTAGQRREGGRTYHGRCRSLVRAGAGWRSSGFGLGGGHEAYDAEVAALVYGLIQLHGRAERGRAYTIFTDSTTAMRRITGDAPGPGQEMATRAIEIAERIVDQGNSITIRWTPAHRGVEGNERADQAARGAAELPPLRTTRDRFSLAYLGRRATERMPRRWRDDTRTRGSGRRAFKVPDHRARPGIRPRFRTARKGIAARFF